MPIAPLQATFVDELSAVTRKLRTAFDTRLRAQGLTLPRARVLLHLARNTAPTQSELARAIEVEQPTMVRLLDGLETQGLVRRCAVDGDRRSKRVRLTEAAERQVSTLRSITDGMRDDILQGVEEGDLEAALRVVRAMAANLGGGQEG